MGKGHKMIDQAVVSTQAGDINYSSQNSNIQSKIRQYDINSSEIRVYKNHA
jgi:hypothetical protein